MINSCQLIFGSNVAYSPFWGNIPLVRHWGALGSPHPDPGCPKQPPDRCPKELLVRSRMAVLVPDFHPGQGGGGGRGSRLGEEMDGRGVSWAREEGPTNVKNPKVLGSFAVPYPTLVPRNDYV